MDRALKKVRVDIALGVSQAVLARSAASRSERASKAAACRSALGADGDSDDEPAKHEADDADRGSALTGASGLVRIDFRDRSFLAARLSRGAVYVEGTMAVLHTVCAACLDAAAEILQQQTAPSAAAPAAVHPNEDDQATPAAQTDKHTSKRVQWCSWANSYQVTYRRGDGKVCRTMAGLKVSPTKSAKAGGVSLQEKMGAFYERAKKTWNDIEERDAARLVLGPSA